MFSIRKMFWNGCRGGKTHGGAVGVRGKSRWGGWGCGAGVLGLLAGCQSFHAQITPRAAVTELSSAPIATDGAMDKRQWDVSEANYVNDAVWAHPEYSPLQVDALSYKANAVVEPVLFLGNLIYIPFGMFVQYPWIFEANKSTQYPPSYTLMPAMPDGTQIPSTY